MKRLTLVIVLALAGLLSLAANPASAEFTANNESTEGNTLFAFAIENAGPTISCGETETGQLVWEIMNEGEASGSGPELSLNFASWGTCMVEYKEEAIATLTGGNCTWKAKEAGSEREIANELISTCKLSGEIEEESCSITLSPESNEKLSTLELANSGESDEHMAVNIELEGATLSASGGGCEAAGIKSTSAATLTGVIEAFEVTPGVALPVFKLFFGGGKFPSMNTLWESRTVIVANSGTEAKPETALTNAGPDFPSFDVFDNTVAKCQGMVLAPSGTCTMTIKYIKKRADGAIAYEKFQILNAAGAVVDQMSIFGRG